MSKNKLPVLDEKPFEGLKDLNLDRFAGAGKMIRRRSRMFLAFLLKHA